MEVLKRREAKRLGLKKYFTGKPCRNGHVAERYISSNCTLCSNERRPSDRNKTSEYSRAYRRRNPQRTVAHSAAARARLQGTDADVEYLAAMPVPTHCPVIGTPISFTTGKGYRARHNVASFDRIDPTKGYVRGNVQIVSFLANTMKTNATPQELLLFADWVYRTYDHLRQDIAA